MSEERRAQLPPLRTFEIILLNEMGTKGPSEGLEAHRMFVEDCGALVLARWIHATWTENGVLDQHVKVFAPGTWHSVIDMSDDFKTVSQFGVKFA